MKRFFSLILASSLLLFASPRAWAESKGGSATEFTVPALNGYSLDFECDSAVSQLYFVWEDAPGGWTLTAFDDSGVETPYACGEYGFLHEYVRLDSPAAKYRFTFSYGGPLGLKGKVYAFGGGEPPGWVEQWLPPCEKADLLVLAARQGDEYLYFGGALPYYADKGKNIQAAYALNGGGEIDAHGLLTALYSAGVRNYPVIEYIEGEDGGARTAFYVGQIRRFKPEVTLGQYEDPNQGAAEAADTSGKDDEYPESSEKYGAWDARKTYLHGFADNEIIMDWHAPLEKSGGKTAAEAALEAFLIQFPSDSSTNARGFVTLYGSGRFGLYRSLAGPDLNGGDFFENTSQAVPPATSETAVSNETARAGTAPEASTAAGSADETAGQEDSADDYVFLPLLGASSALCLALAFILRAKRRDRSYLPRV